MRVTYNGTDFESDIDFRTFRKYAYAREIRYESFEEGVWVVARGSVPREKVQRDLR